jgi:transcriptional regulator of aromatic amino acid metabolism
MGCLLNIFKASGMPSGDEGNKMGYMLVFQMVGDFSEWCHRGADVSDVSMHETVVSATNRDLDEEIHKGAFREDLFFRMNVITMKIPPLRERREDIPALLDHFLKCFAKERGTNSRSTG